MTFSSPSYVKPVSKRTLNKVRSRHRLKVGPKHVSWAGQDLIIERRTQYRGPENQNRVLGHYTINIIRGSPKIVKVLLLFRPLYYGSNDLESRPRICAQLRTSRQTLDSQTPPATSASLLKRCQNDMFHNYSRGVALAFTNRASRKFGSREPLCYAPRERKLNSALAIKGPCTQIIYALALKQSLYTGL